MLTSLLATFTICVLLAANAAPLGKRGSVGYNASDKPIHTFAEATLSPSQAAFYVEMTLVQPTPLPWRRSAATEQTTSRNPDAPGWRAVPASSILERGVKPTPPPWTRKLESFASRAHTETHSSVVEADAPGWKRRATDGDADPTLSLS